MLFRKDLAVLPGPRSAGPHLDKELSPIGDAAAAELEKLIRQPFLIAGRAAHSFFVSMR